MFEVRGRRFGGDAPVFVMAEMAWAHDGSVEHALEIARGTVAAGADCLNIHLTSLPHYMVHDYGAGPGRVSAGHDVEPVFDYLTRISLSADDWQAVAEAVHQGGLALSCMVNDTHSLATADRLGADVLVVPPACMAETPYLEALGERRVPIMLGVGGATLGEIERALALLAKKGAGPLLLQYGIQSYPTRPEALNLRYLGTLREAFGLPVAYHDHTEAGTDLAFEIPMLSLPLGVFGVEKHMTHSRAAKGEDFESALEPAELARFVSDLRAAESALGRGGFRALSEAELNYRRVVRKRAVAATEIPEGARLDYSVIAFKRADAGLYPDEFEAVAGRRARRALAPDEPIEADAID